MDNFIKISEDFSETPGGRLASQGSFSGEEFRDDVLLPKLQLAIMSNSKLTIDLDGGCGYASSFLDEVFGGLIRNHGFRLEDIKDKLIFISNEEQRYIEEINSCLEDAECDGWIARHTY